MAHNRETQGSGSSLASLILALRGPHVHVLPSKGCGEALTGSILPVDDSLCRWASEKGMRGFDVGL